MKPGYSRFVAWFLAIDWIGLPTAPLRLWRRSLQFRAVTLSVVFSALAIVLVGVYMSVTIGNDLFSSRLSQVLSSSARAEYAAQRIYDSSVATDRTAVQSVLNSSLVSIRDASASSLLAFYRAPDTPASALTPQDFVSPEMSNGVITAELRRQVAAGMGTQFWQSTQLDTSAGAQPGVVVGSLVTIPSVGEYELYIGYSFSESERTLAFVIQVLWISGLGLLMLVGAISFVIARLVVRPIQLTADTSQRIAAGDLSARVPELGDDVVTMLARNFNAMARSMERQVTSLEELASIQKQFVADVSHELKTPLTTLKLADEILFTNRESFEPAVRTAVEHVHENVDRFQVLLIDLLEISRYDAQSVTLTVESTDMVALVNDVVSSVSNLAAEYGSVITVHAPGGRGEVIVDPRRIRRILVNILANAIEHGEGRPIEIEIDSNNTAVAVAVTDHGVGMTQEQLDHVFLRFYRADPARARTLGGSGLGLAIAREDAAIHRGTLDAWSELGEGSRFRLVLPRKPSVALTVAPLPLEPAGRADSAVSHSAVSDSATTSVVTGSATSGAKTAKRARKGAGTS